MNRGILKQKAVLLAIPLIIIAGAIIWLIASSSGQSVGTIAEVPRPSQSANSPTKTLHASGKYISFAYPSNFALKSSKPSGPILENFYLATKSIPFDDLAISILPLPSGNLEDLSAYSVRLQDPNHYSLSAMAAGRQTFPVFSDNSGGYAKLAFAQAGKLVATVSLTSQSGDRGQILDKDLQTILASLQWHVP